MSDICPAYDGKFSCERKRGHEGWHRAEVGLPDPATGVAMQATEDPAERSAAIYSWNS